jgi:hypothetical protein
MSRQKEEILCEFEKPKLTGKAGQGHKRIQRKFLIRPFVRIYIVSSIGWILAILFLRYYLPELFENDFEWLRAALMGLGAVFLFSLIGLLSPWLNSLDKSKYVITDKVVKYESSGSVGSIRWKDVDGYKIEEEESPDDEALTVLLYRKNKRVRPFRIVVPQAYIEKVMGLIEQKAEPLREEPPDLELQALGQRRDLKSMILFSLVMGVLAGVLLDFEHIRFLRDATPLGMSLFLVVGPGTLWILVRRPRKIFDLFYVPAAVISNIAGNMPMLLIVGIKHLKDIIDKA